MAGPFGFGATISLRDAYSAPALRIMAVSRSMAGKIGTHASQITKSMGKMAKGFGLLTVGIVGLKNITAPLKVAGQFQQTMQFVGATAKATAEDFDLMRESAINAAKNSVFNINEIADAQLEIARSGEKGNDILTAQSKILDFAVAAQVKLDTATRISLSTMKAYGLKVEDLTDVTDTFIHTANTSMTDVTLLGESFKILGPLAADAGLSLEETAAIFGIFADVNIRGTRSGTGLRNVVKSLINPSANAEKVFQKLAVATRNAAGSQKDMADIVNELGEAGVDVQDIFRLFNIRGASAFAALKKIGGDGMKSLFAQTEAAKGETQRVKDAIMDGPVFALKQLNAAWSATQQRLADLGMLRFVTELMLITKDFVNVLTTFIEENNFLARWAVTTLGLSSAFLVLAGTALFLQGAMVILKGITILGLGAMATGFVAILALAPKLIALVGIMIAMKSALFGTKDAAGHGFLKVFEDMQLVFGGIGELIDSYDPDLKIGFISDETRENLKEAGLFGFTKKLFMTWARIRGFFEGITNGIKKSFEDLGTAIRAVFPKKGDEVFNNIKEFLGFVGNEKVRSSIGDWEAIGTHYGAIAAAFSAIALAIPLIKISLLPLKLMFSTMAVAADAAVLAFGGTKAAGAAGMLTGGIGLIGSIVAVGGSLAWLVLRWGEFGDKLDTDGWLGPFQLFAADVFQLMGGLLDTISTLFNSVGATKMGKFLKDVAKGASLRSSVLRGGDPVTGEGATSGILDIGGKPGSVLDKIDTAITANRGIIEQFKHNLSEMFSFGADTANDMKNIFSDSFTGRLLRPLADGLDLILRAYVSHVGDVMFGRADPFTSASKTREQRMATAKRLARQGDEGSFVSDPEMRALNLSIAKRLSGFGDPAERADQVARDEKINDILNGLSSQLEKLNSGIIIDVNIDDEGNQRTNSRIKANF